MLTPQCYQESNLPCKEQGTPPSSPSLCPQWWKRRCPEKYITIPC
jgi:hypothetical protein